MPESDDKIAAVSISIIKKDQTDIEFISDHVGKCLHYLGLKEYKIIHSNQRLKETAVTKQQWEKWYAEIQGICDLANKNVYQRFAIVANDPFIPRSKRYPAKLKSASLRAFDSDECMENSPIWLCFCLCIVFIVYQTLLEIYQFLIANICGTLCGFIADLCTGTCSLPCLAIKYTPVHMDWLQDNLFNHPEYTSKSMDDTLQEGLKTLVKKIRSDVTGARASFIYNSEPHDDDDGKYNNIEFRILMNFSVVAAASPVTAIAPMADEEAPL